MKNNKSEKYHYPTYKEIVAEHIRSFGVVPSFEEKMRYQGIKIIVEDEIPKINTNKGVIFK